MLRKLAAGAICGVVAGIPTGIAARAAMRMVADGVPDPIRQLPSFTVEGSTAIVIIFALAGAAFGVLFALAHDALPGPRSARGVLFGLAMLATVGPLFFTGARDEFITRERMVLFSFLFPLFGAVAGLVLGPSRRLARRMPEAGLVIFVLVALGGGALIAAVIAGAFVTATQIHGVFAIAYAVPWLAVGLLAGLALRSRVAPAPLVR